MLKRLARAAALPGVGEAMATTSASWERCWKEAAWMSAWNWEPIMPTFTLPSAIRAPMNTIVAFVLTPSKRRQDRRTPNLGGCWVVAAYEFLVDAVAFVL